MAQWNLGWGILLLVSLVGIEILYEFTVQHLRQFVKIPAPFPFRRYVPAPSRHPESTEHPPYELR